MLPLLLTLLLTAAPVPTPCSAQEGTVVCQCKQGVASACDALRQVDPKLAARLEKAAAKNRASAAKQPRLNEQAQPAQTATATVGQEHHAISRPIFKELETHATLKGHYTARDPRFVTRAADKASHNGYQQWHRKLDEEVIQWLRTQKEATPEQFERFLRELYKRPDLRARFPNGL